MLVSGYTQSAAIGIVCTDYEIIATVVDDTAELVVVCVVVVSVHAVYDVGRLD